jgi:hypothetical protein
MTQTPQATQRSGVRAVTDAEAEHFAKNGWVRLDGFVEPWLVEFLLERGSARLGSTPGTLSTVAPDALQPNEFRWYERWDGPSHQDEEIYKISHSTDLAAAAAKLMGVQDEIRFYYDHFFIKLPAAQAGVETPWHQDLPHHPLDRQGALTMWIPLVDCPPEKGSMRFLNGSHRVGNLGRYLNRDDGVDLISEHSWIKENFEVSPELHLAVGDATVHDLGITHYAPENRTDTPRWVYVVQWLPPTARYTGAPNHRTDGRGLQLDRPLDHPLFPIIKV